MIVVDDLASTLKNLVNDVTGTAVAAKTAVWQSYQPDDPVRVLSGVPYKNNESSPYQSLDMFFPTDFISPVIDDANNNDDDDEAKANDDNKEANNNKKIALLKSRPVYVFIHGGGWSRGSKSNYLYGAPSMCKNMCTTYGCISISVGYRLGKYPEFMYDVAYGIQWIQNNIVNLGGNINQMYLSGHSAGAHISSLLMIKYDKFLEPFNIRKDLFKCIALISGVYDLFCPMKKALLDAKNKTFVLGYVIPAFGYNEQLRYNASPLLLLNPSIKETSILGTIPLTLYKQVSETYTWSVVTTIPKRLSSFCGTTTISSSSNFDSSSDLVVDRQSINSNSNNIDEESSEYEGKETLLNEAVVAVANPTIEKPNNKDKKEADDEEEEEEDEEKTQEQQESKDSSIPSPDDDDDNDDIIRTDLPPIILLNAWFDMGLEENGKLMKQALEGHDIFVRHEIIPATDHASICWNQKTVDTITQFFQDLTTTTTTTAPKPSSSSSSRHSAIMARGGVTSNGNVVLDG